ncbi:ABC transporter ATP-binding protein [Bosea psychrotolerans]|uniref:Spermidine/putrescine import ATP-binding protein PotA n=1 Tax=Bosea psychrotolerans TaxID=1871628 RepID=A0A2S4M2N6_9HYPH|nr:ABC transporter ATP-binding protein [Bosea psychrotolerans]POR48971.1 spermidine/putrescine ABC transporter ATP-binding subunit [Bosea psychrotolerans]
MGQGTFAKRKASPGSVRRAFQPWNDPQARPLVEFRNVTKRFGPVTAVDGLSLSLYPREFFALLGPSGCGKTTLMRMLAGFERPDSGAILLDGVDITAVPPHLRPVNMMFQSYALFPHLSVADNIGYGLRREGLARPEIARRVAEMLALVKLEGLGARRPDQLSGGQRQRVALARSLAKRPKLLLLDEPMAALDRKLREATQFELMDLQSTLGTAFMVVTHDQDEAMTMADRMAVMDHGRLVQIGPPDVIYEAPVSRYVAEFVGDINVLEGRVSAVEGDLVRVESAVAGPLELDEDAPGFALGDTLLVGLRPEKIALSHDEPAQGLNKVRGEIWDIGYLGDVTMIQVMVGGEGGTLLKVALANRTRRIERPFAWDDAVWLSWDVEAGLALAP